MTMTPSGIAKEATLARRFGGSKLAYSGLLTADHDITPSAPTKSIRLLWVAFVPNPDNSGANLVTVGFEGASTPVYTGYALAHWEMFDGAPGVPLQISLANNQPVAVTVHYEEF